MHRDWTSRDPRAMLREIAPYRDPSTTRSTFEIAVTAVPFALLWFLTWAALDAGYWAGLLLTIPAAGLLVLAGVQWLAFWIPWGGGGTGIAGSFLILGQEQGVLLTVVLTVALVNAMNFVDGLDGLATGATTAVAGSYLLIGVWQSNQSCQVVATAGPNCYEVRDPRDLAVVAAALMGACFGFLWWNAAPARIIMGDVGALAIGSAMALLALTLDTHLLLLLICGINVMEAGSVAVQMGVFKASRRTRRLFRMSPVHHHFELLGWPETTVIIRFWLIAAICVASALAIFIGDFTRIAAE